jgi:hypothetical protein
MADETKTVVTERAEMVTVKQASNVAVILMTPLRIVATRAARVYLQTLVGLLSAFGLGAAADVGVTMAPGTFWHTFAACAGLSLAPTVMSILQNTLELLAKADATMPQLRA